MMRRLAILCALLLLVSGSGVVAAATAGPPPRGHAIPAGDFVAVYGHGTGDVTGGHQFVLDAFSPRTGEPVKTILRLRHGANFPNDSLSDFSRAPDGAIWYAISTGPDVIAPGVANPPIKPHTCGGSIYRMDPNTGVVRRVVTVGRDATVSQPVISPDGDRLGYVSEQCQTETSTPTSDLVVRTLATGQQHDTYIAQGTPYDPAWTHGGKRLVADIMVAGNQGGQGQLGYLDVAASRSGRLPLSAIKDGPDWRCPSQGVTADARGVVLDVACGVRQQEELMQLAGNSKRILWQHPVGRCGGVDEMSPDRSGQAVIANTECSTHGHGIQQVVRWSDTGHQHRLGRYQNPKQWVDSATW